jgi:hypothetical protein
LKILDFRHIHAPTPLQDLLTEALNDLFKKYGKAEIAADKRTDAQ